MNDREIEILTPLLGADMARLVCATYTLAHTCHELSVQVNETQAPPQAAPDAGEEHDDDGV